MGDDSYLALAMFGLLVFALGAALGGRPDTATLAAGIGFGALWGFSMRTRVTDRRDA